MSGTAKEAGGEGKSLGAVEGTGLDRLDVAAPPTLTLCLKEAVAGEGRAGLLAVAAAATGRRATATLDAGLTLCLRCG